MLFKSEAKKVFEKTEPRFRNHLKKGGGMLANVSNVQRPIPGQAHSMPLGETVLDFRPKKGYNMKLKLKCKRLRTVEASLDRFNFV